MTTVAGVDPGLTGAICLLGRDRFDIVDMPTVAGNVDPYALAALFVAWGPVDRVAVEQVHAMPRQGVSSTFKFGVGYGTLLGVLAVLERPVVHVSPNVWTKALGVGADKELHRRRALDRWPQHAAMFKRKNDGRADAALIALWMAEQMAGVR